MKEVLLRNLFAVYHNHRNGNNAQFRIICIEKHTCLPENRICLQIIKMEFSILAHRNNYYAISYKVLDIVSKLNDRISPTALNISIYFLA